MDNAIQIFKFENERQIRVIEGEGGDPRWVAKDIAEALDYNWSGIATIGHVPEEWRGINSVLTPSGKQDMQTLTEAGVFFFMARSDKPKALPLQKWIASEVLPSIRKTGSYSMIPSAPPTPANVVLAMAQALVDIEGRVERLEAVQQAAATALLELPAPTTAAPEKSLRAALNENVRAYAQKTGVAFPDVWGKLYRELKYRASLDAPTRSKHTRKSTLDIVEEAGLLPELYAIAREVLR